MQTFNPLGAAFASEALAHVQPQSLWTWARQERVNSVSVALWPLQDKRHDEILFKVFCGNTSCIIGAKKNKSKLSPPPFSLVIHNWNHIEVRVDNFKTTNKTAVSIKVGIGKAAHYMGSRLLCSSRFSLPLFSDVSLFTQESTSVYIKYRLTQMSVHLSCFWMKLYRGTWSISDVASSGNWVSRVPCLLCWYWVWSDWQRLGIGHETWLSPSWFLQSPNKPSKIISEWLVKVILFLHSNHGQNDFGLL